MATSSKARISVLDMIIKARIAVLSKYVYMTEAICRMDPMAVTIPQGPMATDGKKLYYDPKQIPKYTGGNICFIVMHECLHCVLGHLWRIGDRDRDLWNIAVDMVVNQILQEWFHFSKDVPEGIYFPPDELKDSFAEKIYEWLKKNGGGSGGKGKITGKLLSDHGKWSDIQVKNVEEASRMAKQWEEVLSRLYGTMLGGTALALEYGYKSRIAWESELFSFVKATVAHDFSNRMFRRVRAGGISVYYPRLQSPSIRLAVFLDVSGSISDRQRNQMLAEVMRICQSFDYYELLLMAGDTRVTYSKILRPGDSLPESIEGGGGTDFRPFFDEVEKEQFNPDCLIGLTDTFGSFPVDPPTYSVIWGVVGVSEWRVPWGRALDIILG